jgi:hypothetical protein
MIMPQIEMVDDSFTQEIPNGHGLRRFFQILDTVIF